MNIGIKKGDYVKYEYNSCYYPARIISVSNLIIRMEVCFDKKSKDCEIIEIDEFDFCKIKTLKGK